MTRKSRRITLWASQHSAGPSSSHSRRSSFSGEAYGAGRLVPRPADQVHRPVRAGRNGRSDRANACRPGLRNPGSARGRREQGGRGRVDRDRLRRSGAGGRLHRSGAHQRDRERAAAQAEPHVQLSEGHDAAGHDRRDAVRPARAPVAARQFGQGGGRLREGESRKAQLRRVGRRVVRSPSRRAVQARDRHQHGLRSLRRRRRHPARAR